MGGTGQFVVTVHLQGIKARMRGLDGLRTGEIRAPKLRAFSMRPGMGGSSGGCRGSRTAKTFQSNALLDVCQALGSDLVQRQQCVASGQDVVILRAQAQQPNGQFIHGAENFVQRLGGNSNLQLIFGCGIGLAWCGLRRSCWRDYRPDRQSFYGRQKRW